MSISLIRVMVSVVFVVVMFRDVNCMVDAISFFRIANLFGKIVFR